MSAANEIQPSGFYVKWDCQKCKCENYSRFDFDNPVLKVGQKFDVFVQCQACQKVNDLTCIVENKRSRK